MDYASEYWNQSSRVKLKNNSSQHISIKYPNLPLKLIVNMSISILS